MKICQSQVILCSNSLSVLLNVLQVFYPPRYLKYFAFTSKEMSLVYIHAHCNSYRECRNRLSEIKKKSSKNGKYLPSQSFGYLFFYPESWSIPRLTLYKANVFFKYTSLSLIVKRKTRYLILLTNTVGPLKSNGCNCFILRRVIQ